MEPKLIIKDIPIEVISPKLVEKFDKVTTPRLAVKNDKHKSPKFTRNDVGVSPKVANKINKNQVSY